MNIFNGLLKFKNQVDDAMLNQSEALKSMLNDTAGEIDAQFSGMLGRAYQVSGNNSSGWTVSSYVANAGSLALEDSFHSESWDELQSSALYQNAIADNVRCADFNTALSSITTSFLSNAKISVTQVISTLNNFVNTRQGEVQELINNILQVADQGEISQQQWISILSSISNGVNQGEESGTFELDTTNPFTFQGVMGLVMQALSNVVEIIFTAIYSVVKGIFGAIAFIASKLMSLLFNNTIVSNELQLSPNCPNSYVKGPMCAFDSSSLDFVWEGFPDAKSPVRVLDVGPVDFYFWTSTAGDLLVNSYLKCNYSLTKVINLIQGHKVDQITQNNKEFIGWKWLPTLGSQISECELSADETITCQYDASYALDAIAASALVTIISSMNAAVESDAEKVFGIESTSAAGDGITFLYRVFKDGVLGDNHNSIELDFIKKFVAAGFNDRTNIYLSGDTFRYGESKTIELFTDNPPNTYTLHYTLPGLQYPFYPLFERTMSGSPSTGFKYSVRFWNPSRDTAYFPATAGDEIPAPPSKWLITVPDFDVTTVVTFLIVLAGVVAATVVTGLKLSKAIKTRRLGKQLSAQNELSRLRAEYVNHPSSSNLAAYNKAIKKYNFKAKLFGWYTYDGQNQWYDEPGSVSSIGTELSVGTAGASLPSINDILTVIKG